MKLQKLVIEKINAKYSKSDFINCLNILKLQGSQEEANLFDNVIFYYSLFFRMDINHVSDVIKYRFLRQNLRCILVEKLNNNC